MNTTMRRAFGAGIIATAMAAGTVTTASAGSSRPADAWASFTAPVAWVDRSDNLQWYASSQQLTRAMVNKVLTIRVDTTGIIDCANLGAGYQGAAGWVTAAPRAGATCSGSRLVESFTVTRAMVGHQLFVNGWSAVGSATHAAVHGTTAVGASKQQVQVTAEKTVPTAPDRQGTAIGIWNGTPVRLSSAGGINEVIVGDGATARRYPTLPGEPFHVGLADGRVDLWTYSQTEGLVTQWHLDLATGVVVTSSIPGAVVVGSATQVGTPGFWMRNDTDGERQLYDWAGRLRYRGGVLDPRAPVGFTSTAAVGLTGHMTPDAVIIIPLDGSPSVTVQEPDAVHDPVVDATGVNYTVSGTAIQKVLRCRLEQGWSTSQCTPA